jgi:hypothetical protein
MKSVTVLVKVTILWFIFDTMADGRGNLQEIQEPTGAPHGCWTSVNVNVLFI